MKRVLFSLVFLLLCLLPFLTASTPSFAQPELGPVTVAICDAPEHQPARWVRTPEQLPIRPLEPAGLPAVPVSYPAVGWLLLELTLMAGVGVLSVWIWRRESAKRRPTRRPATGSYGAAYAAPKSRNIRAIAAAATGCLAIALVVEHSSRFVAARYRLGDVEEALEQRRHDQAGEQLARLQVGLRRSLLGWLTPGLDTSLERIDVGRLREVNGMMAVRDALERRDGEAAVEALGYLEPRSPDGVRTANAALSFRAQELLDQRKTSDALQYALRGRQIDALNPEVNANLCAARYHHALTLTRQGRLTEATSLTQALEPPGCEVDAETRAALRGVVARSIAQEHLVAERPGTAEAVAAEEQAFDYMTSKGLHIPFIRCDYAAALDPHAVALLAQDRPDEAVTVLDRSDELVPGQQFVGVALPQALLALGTKRLGEQQLDGAITALERAYSLGGPEDQAIVDMLTMAHVSKGSSLFAERDYGGAVASLSRAHEVKPRDRNVTLALADSRLEKADSHLRTGDLSAAELEIEQVATLTPQRRLEMEMRRDVMSGTPRRLRQLAQTSEWLNVPDFQGEMPKDIDADGRADGVLYYSGTSDRPAAIGYLSSVTEQPETVLLLGPEGEVVTALRDNDHDGVLDERIDYQGQDIAKLIIDSDQDASPDVEINYDDEIELVRQYLSGNVSMRFKSGVVSASVDFVTDADAYIKLFRNGSFISKTNTAIDTNFPSWNHGVVVHYRAGDVVRLEAWDEDVFFDDPIDYYQFNTYPASGIFRFHDRKVAVEIDVVPTDLPEGHEVWTAVPSTYNIFRDNPTAIPSVAEIVTEAHNAHERADIRRAVTKWVILEILVPRLLPPGQPVQNFLIELVIENLVVDPLLPD